MYSLSAIGQGAARVQRQVLPVSTSPGSGTGPGIEKATGKHTKPKMRNLKGSSCALKKVLIRYKLVILLMRPLYCHGLPEMKHHLDELAVDIGILQSVLTCNLNSN